jgi:hypothetical protein
MNKRILITLGFALCATAFAAPTVDEARLNAYRAEFKDSVVPVKYVFVNEDGSPCCSTGRKGRVYLLNIGASAPAELAYSPEIDKLFRDKFEIEIDSESLISTLNADYVVLTMSRPAEYNKKYVPCAGGMGESRAYLVSVSGNKAAIINRQFGGCGKAYQVMHEGKTLGYEITSGADAIKPIKIFVDKNPVIMRNGESGKAKR